MLDLNLHHDHQDQNLFSPNLQSSSSFSSISNPIFLMTPSDLQSLAPKLGGSCDFTMQSHQQEACNPPRVDESSKGLKFKIKMREDRKKYETGSINNSAKWMSSKMRMMRKMITSSDNGSTVVNHPPTTITKLEDHDQRLSSPDNSSNSSSCNNSSSSVRVCTDCNTTKTPLWRSGPTGPKSLCNACGIRQRKARRAMAAAANGTASNIPPPMKKVLKLKNKRPPATHNNGPQFKKRCKINIKNTPSKISSRKTISFEDLRMTLISTSGFEQVFPQDEKEAAILLMALSYGLVH